MWRMIPYYIIQQLLFFTSSVELLRGSKIVSTDIREFPFIVSLQHPDGEHFCSGTLITYKHIITAMHCLDNQHPGEVQAALGVTNLLTTTVRYTVASWITYDVWASRLRLKEAMNFHDIAIVTLSDEITQRNVRPVRLTDLNKQQVQGKPSMIVGWSDYTSTKVLKKAIVNILSDEDCNRNIRLITNNIRASNLKLLCTAAKPYALLQKGDSGGPLLDVFGALLGVNVCVGPQTRASWANVSDEFLNSYQINLHSIISYHYRYFIVNVTGYH